MQSLLNSSGFYDLSSKFVWNSNNREIESEG